MLEYKFLFTYLQLWRSYAILSSTTRHLFRSTVDILSTLWWSRLIWRNFVKVAVNWIKTCTPAQIRMYNRRVKFRLNIPNHLGKNVRKFQGRGFDWHCSTLLYYTNTTTRNAINIKKNKTHKAKRIKTHGFTTDAKELGLPTVPNFSGQSRIRLLCPVSRTARFGTG